MKGTIMQRQTNGQFKFKPFKKSNFSGLKLMIFTIAVGVFINWLYTEPQKPSSPIVKAQEPSSPIVQPIESVKIVVPGEENLDASPRTDNPQKLDIIIGQAVDEFFVDRTQRSEMRMTMHCLAHRENGHAANRNCGDSGKSCGPFQFRSETWTRMRNQMIKAGFATEIGDLYNLKESARTTAWAIKNGRAKEWGPILRDSKGSDFATCQLPGWYRKD